MDIVELKWSNTSTRTPRTVTVLTPLQVFEHYKYDMSRCFSLSVIIISNIDIYDMSITFYHRHSQTLTHMHTVIIHVNKTLALITVCNELT